MTPAERKQLREDPVAFCNWICTKHGVPKLTAWQEQIVKQMSATDSRWIFLRSPGRRITIRGEYALERLLRLAKIENRFFTTDECADVRDAIEALRTEGMPATDLSTRMESVAIWSGLAHRLADGSGPLARLALAALVKATGRKMPGRRPVHGTGPETIIFDEAPQEPPGSEGQG